MTKEIPRSERPESLPVEMSLIFLENPESPNVKSVPKSFENEKYSSKFCLPKLQNGGGSIGIWGCINLKGTVCCTIYTDRITQYFYMETLENHFLPSAEIFFIKLKIGFFSKMGIGHIILIWFETGFKKTNTGPPFVLKIT